MICIFYILNPIHLEDKNIKHLKKGTNKKERKEMSSQKQSVKSKNMPDKTAKKEKQYNTPNDDSKNKKTEYHPCIVVGEIEDKYANFGTTHSKYRGHHKNHELVNSKGSYVRDDLSLHDKKLLQEILPDTKIDTDDISFLSSIIEKYKKRGKH